MKDSKVPSYSQRRPMYVYVSAITRLFNLLLLLVGILSFALPSEAYAAPVAKLYSVQGGVEGKVNAQADWAGVGKGQKFSPQDQIRTLARSRAGIRFASGFLVRLNEKTTITFDDKDPGKKTQGVSLVKGVGHFFNRQRKRTPRVRTPQLSASMRGTELVVAVNDDKTTITVLDGAVEASNQYGTVVAGKGEQAVAVTGQAPVKQILLNPYDAVQWALYYPAVLSMSDFAGFLQTTSDAEQRGIEALKQGEFEQARQMFAAGTWRDAMGRALAWYQAGNASKAFEEMSAFQGDAGADFFLFNSGLMLSAGQHQQAVKFLDQAEAKLAGLDADTGSKLSAGIKAQRAITALIQNRKGDAETLAAEAVKLNPSSASAALVMSFVEQAKFNLPEAKKWLEKTMELEPKSALARARYAELLLGFGDFQQAREIADESIQQGTNDAYVLSVRGFIELVAQDAEKAQEFFRKAINADESFSSPHLGLGLAMIRDGEVAAGREELEAAVQLDPSVSLYRSYLGKAFYEEERSDYARREYEQAMTLDPRDPTPYLYRSLLNLADHRPIEALTDLQESIERNENRAVFRSRLLLDQDVGTRSVGLGRIFSRIGFTQRARVEAIRALNKDYSNYSAHFLLADLYRDTHLNSRAQITENLLGRLLSPVNFNANNINIGGSAGLNEYTTLFERPVQRASIQAFGETQTDRFGGRIDYTYSDGTVGVNLGYAGSYREGFRENDWSREHQLFSLGQYQIDEESTFVWDAALTTMDQGDTIVNFDPLSEDIDFQNKFDGYLVRGGYRRRFGPGSNFIAQIFHNYGDFEVTDRLSSTRLTFIEVSDGGIKITADPFTFDGRTDEFIDTKQHLTRADIQYIHDSELVSVVVGGSGRYETLESAEDGFISDVGSEPLLVSFDGFLLGSGDTIDQQSYRGFLYSTWHLTSWLDVDAGVVYEKIKLSENALNPPFVDETFNKDQWSPKAGLVIKLTDDTDLRLAYAKTLDRTGRGGIGPLEPTFVGGFNQVFDGVRGSKQEFFGAGIDHRFSKKTYAGVSYQRRELTTRLPVLEGGLDIDRGTFEATPTLRPSVIFGEAEIDRINAYLYQILSSTVAGTLEYDWEKFEENEPLPESVTARGAFGVQYFDTSGLFAFGKATFRYQERSGSFFPREIHDFWILDAGVGYELDQRHGAITLRFDNILDRSFRYSAIGDEGIVLPDFGARLDVSYNF